MYTGTRIIGESVVADPAPVLTGVKLPFSWGALTDVGKEREQNEDTFAAEPEAGIFLVTDGMGGHRGGQLAAHTIAQDLPPAIETKLATQRGQQPRAIRRMLYATVAEQSRQLHLEGHSEDGYRDMGATLVLALLRDSRAYVVNLGDSRIYRYRKGKLRQYSRDHSVIAELLEDGHIESHEAESHEDVGVITRYVGMETRARSSVRSFAMQPNDRILLCTDGLTDMVDEATITRIMREENETQACCDRLVAKANGAGGHDNITVLIVDWHR